MVREATDICLRVLKESSKSRFDSFSRYEQCIDHIPYYLSGLSRAHFFRQPFSKQLYTQRGPRSSSLSLYKLPTQVPYFIMRQKAILPHQKTKRQHTKSGVSLGKNNVHCGIFHFCFSFFPSFFLSFFFLGGGGRGGQGVISINLGYREGRHPKFIMKGRGHRILQVLPVKSHQSPPFPP